MGTGKVKPSWLTITPPVTERYNLIRNLEVNTICSNSKCPNMAECWDSGTATFLILGNVCTRNCRFCNVSSGKPLEVNKKEAYKVKEIVKKLNLNYVVLTSVDRDDLEDFGAGHFYDCIKILEDVNVEALIPDFQGNLKCLRKVVSANPKVVGHNIELVKSLQYLRDARAGYEVSLNVLKNIKKLSGIFTKSSIMLGLGEKKEEVISSMKDLRKVKVDFLTVGQYLRPSKRNVEVERYISPEEFNEYREIGEKLGFRYVASGPFVRSSYRAGEIFESVK